MTKIDREYRLHKQLDHPNIVKCYQLHKTNNGKLGLILEYCEGGSLSELIRDQGPLLYDTAVYASKCLAEAIKYLHDLNIVHCDIKPHNILISNGTIKLADFGSAVVVGSVAQVKGTEGYRPKDFNGNIDKSFDMWSYGVVVKHMLYGNNNNSSSSNTKLDSIIKGCLNKNSSTRYTIEEVLDVLDL